MSESKSVFQVLSEVESRTKLNAKVTPTIYHGLMHGHC